jgi:hypothetical protein
MDYCFNPQYIGCDWTVKTKFSLSSILKNQIDKYNFRNKKIK